MKKENVIYIVAGDEMKKIMGNKYPNRIIIPFRENLSIGQNHSFIIDFSRLRLSRCQNADIQRLCNLFEVVIG